TRQRSSRSSARGSSGSFTGSNVADRPGVRRLCGSKEAAVRLSELTMPLDHQWMPDEIFPTATRFMLAPRGDPEKGITVGTESGTSLLLPAQFAAFRRTRRLHEIEP